MDSLDFQLCQEPYIIGQHFHAYMDMQHGANVTFSQQHTPKRGLQKSVHL
jgi:hypothetical protein